jgi:hypothetical protein
MEAEDKPKEKVHLDQGGAEPAKKENNLFLCAQRLCGELASGFSLSNQILLSRPARSLLLDNNSLPAG